MMDSSTMDSYGCWLEDYVWGPVRESIADYAVVSMNTCLTAPVVAPVLESVDTSVWDPVGDSALDSVSRSLWGSL
jgi:hypothetical protein